MNTETEPKLTMRSGTYVRKSDGLHVKAGDWSDGTVTYMPDPLPLISMGKAVKTCSLKKFEREYSLSAA